MDFLTSLPYWGILVVVIVNAVIVSRLNIELDQANPEENESNQTPD